MTHILSHTLTSQRALSVYVMSRSGRSVKMKNSSLHNEITMRYLCHSILHIGIIIYSNTYYLCNPFNGNDYIKIENIYYMQVIC